jgi:integrase
MLTDTKIAAIKPPSAGQAEHPDNKVTGLRLRVGHGGTKTWIVRRRVGAKVLNKKLGTYPAMGLAAARKAAEKLIEALERDGSTDAIERTFGDVADFWIKNVAIGKNAKWEGQERQLELHVLPAWADRKIVEIKRRDVRDLLDNLEGRVLPNRVLALIKTIFRYALSRDWIEASPIEGIDKPRSEKARDRVLDMDEVSRIWSAAELLGFPYGPFVRLSLLTAQRRGEVAGMRRTHLDLKAATWTIPAADTKADRAQMVPLSPQAVAIIEALPDLGDYVFTTTGDTPISGFAKAKTRLDHYLSRKGNPLGDWRFHDLRRTAATHMVRLGITETIVSRVLNHAVQGVTAQVYALHSYAPEKRSALDRWAAEIDRAAAGKPADTIVKLRG